jgi:glycosyltransferase involved in cell wall biosynthesis
VLSAWLYYPSLIASLIGPFLPAHPRVIWHIRSLPFVRFKDRPARWLAQRLLATLSHIIDVHILSNSEAARVAHAAIGFRTDRWRVIPNAVDASRYAFKADARASIRASLHLPNSAIVIGTVGRNVPEKGYPDLFKAIDQLQKRLPSEAQDRLHLLIAGRDVTLETPSIAALVDGTGLPRDRFHLLGARGDVAELLSAMDLFVMPSRSESFPNALAEAMAVGLPAIATDVGDCRVVLDDNRFITTADTIADGLTRMIMLTADEQHAIGTRNRKRIAERYTMEKMTAAFDRVFEGG